MEKKTGWKNNVHHLRPRKINTAPKMSDEPAQRVDGASPKTQQNLLPLHPIAWIAVGALLGGTLAYAFRKKT